MKIKITVGDVTLTAALSSNDTAKAIYEALPFNLPYNTWGNEIYFGIPVKTGEAATRNILEVGELAFWPPGNAFCIFYGTTPASTDDRPRAASEIIPIGRVEGDVTALKNASASKIQIEKLEE